MTGPASARTGVDDPGVEVLASIMCGLPWSRLAEEWREHWREQAIAALANVDHARAAASTAEVDDDAVEVYARHLFSQVDELYGDTWDGTSEKRRGVLRRLARESLTAAALKPAGGGS